MSFIFHDYVAGYTTVYMLKLRIISLKLITY